MAYVHTGLLVYFQLLVLISMYVTTVTLTLVIYGRLVDRSRSPRGGNGSIDLFSMPSFGKLLRLMIAQYTMDGWMDVCHA